MLLGARNHGLKVVSLSKRARHVNHQCCQLQRKGTGTYSCSIYDARGGVDSFRPCLLVFVICLGQIAFRTKSSSEEVK